MMRDPQGNIIELLKVFSPPAVGPRERRALNQFGLTHIAFWDDTPQATVDRLTALGGHFLPEAHVRTSAIELHHGQTRMASGSN